MRTIGIDPSLRQTGFGIVESRGNVLRPICFGVIKTDSTAKLEDRLLDIERELEKIIEKYAPSEAAVENPFYARNIKTAITLGQVRGAVLVALSSQKCKFYQYSALEIKKAVTGHGQASKDQVQVMVRALLGLDESSIPDDASDALAAAICHLNRMTYREIILKDK